ncbi:hypothetical protein GH714_007125 [Hevea brasiliensis]|uniref:CCHC-type domain-containing protein n=1 Tax=Hevea brasiliensis TaxID=3981 RepID=A0A6A6MYM8_HEVBR|nr:hypothetical protein GH714_007125 [Hevea brasiliensis]
MEKINLQLKRRKGKQHKDLLVRVAPIVGGSKGANSNAPKAYNPYAKPAAIKCYRCNKIGHRSNECPKRKSVNIVEREPEDEEEEFCGSYGDDFEEEYEQEEGVYVVRILILSPKAKDNTQRHKLFQTRCTVNGKIFDLIINGGSQENIINRRAIQKLSLAFETSTSLHYRMNQGSWRNLSERALQSSFFIGKYVDKTYCDIVDMDACHILLGRPWQFDVNEKHSGQKNTYQLEKEGKIYTLVPIGEKKPTKVSKVEERDFLSITNKPSKFAAECKETK